MDERTLDRVIEMAWEDRTPFEAIKFQFNLSEADVIKIMRKELKNSSFKLWRKRVHSGVSQKHVKKGVLLFLDLNVVGSAISPTIKFLKDRFRLQKKPLFGAFFFLKLINHLQFDCLERDTYRNQERLLLISSDIHMNNVSHLIRCNRIPEDKDFLPHLSQ